MTNRQIFDLCMYLATSAEGLIDEPKDYGPLRLLEVLERLAVLGADAHEDAFLRGIAEAARERMDLVMTDSEAFHRELEELVIKFVVEAKRRATGTE